MPVIRGYKTEKEKFAGGLRTTTVEAYIPATGRAIQGATSHNLGQNFGKMFKIEYEDTQGKKQIPWQTSWGFTTRSIGVMVMSHSDDKGLVLPPRIAPMQVVLVPIVDKKIDHAQQKKVCEDLAAGLRAAKVRVTVDDRDNYNPGWKYNHWELKGVPLRMELGPKDLEKGVVRLVRRDTNEKEDVPWALVPQKVALLLVTMQHDLLAKARGVRDAALITVMKWEDFSPVVSAGKLALTPFCNDENAPAMEARGRPDASNAGPRPAAHSAAAADREPARPTSVHRTSLRISRRRRRSRRWARRARTRSRRRRWRPSRSASPSSSRSCRAAPSASSRARTPPAGCCGGGRTDDPGRRSVALQTLGTGGWARE